MKKELTPQRWTPSRRPVWFDEQDVRRVVDHLRPTHAPLVNVIGPKFRLSDMYAAMIFRLPKQPEFRLDIRTRDTWKPDVAKTYLSYLGFPKEFSDAYLKMYGPQGESNISSGKRFSAFAWKVLLGTLSSFKSGDLRKILTPDEESTEKWEHRLEVCGSTWKTMKIPARSIRRIIGILYRESHGVEPSKDWIEARQRMTAKK